MVFRALTFAGSQGRCLNTSPQGSTSQYFVQVYSSKEDHFSCQQKKKKKTRISFSYVTPIDVSFKHSWLFPVIYNDKWREAYIDTSLKCFMLKELWSPNVTISKT